MLYFLKSKLSSINIEKLYPAIISFLITFILVHFRFLNFAEYKKFDNLLDGIITLSSVTVGFLGVLISILFTLRDTELIQKLFASELKNDLYDYFNKTLHSGILVIIFSNIFYLRDEFKSFTIFDDLLFLELISVLWTWLVLYFSLTSYRIVNVMMQIVFKSHSATEKRPLSEPISNEELKELNNSLKNNSQD
ncbi:hypothetical protein [Natroniella sp. ANB-PHB2]|uniref:hypothetical protein n=1 Tax=Natroniella sp. ANB-PHB2 TaxID=3384444 RepID=UPI0038D504F6